ncbi:MAG: ComEC/Rec2 family competence protein, partial [Flavobacteriaceae bacterium]
GGFLILALVYFISNKVLNPRFYFAVTGFILFVLLGVGRMTLNKEVDFKTHYTHHLKNANSLVLEVNKVLKPSKKYTKYEVRVSQIDSQKTSGKLLFYLKKDSTQSDLKIGQFLFTNATIRELPKPQNPYQFDYKTYLENKHIYRQIYTDKSAIILLDKRKKSLYSYAQDFRTRIVKAFVKKGLKGDELAVVEALLLGEKQDISTSLRQDYANAGAVHILAISGLHIGIIMFLLSWLLKPLEYFKNGKNYKLIIIILFLWVYAVIAGLSPSIIRATTMFTALSISLFSNRKTDVYNILALSAFVLLLINPHYLFDVGFQMSYLAVLAIVAIQPKLVALWHPKYKIVRYFWQLLCVSTAAQIGVVPLSLYYFHQFPGLFFLTNLVVIPLLGFILGFGLLLVFLASINSLPAILMSFYQTIINYLNLFISWIAHQERFLIQNISFSLALLLVSYFVIIAFYNWTETKKSWLLQFTLVAVLSLQSILFYEKYTSNKTNQFVIFNSYNESLLTLKKAQNLRILTKDKPNEAVLKSYLIGAHIKNIIQNKKVQNVFRVNGKKVLLIGKKGVYEPVVSCAIVVITQSPKINLQRLIEKLKPQLIIADNTNYKSFVTRWQKTCKQLNIPFYDVSRNGAYIYSF